MRYRRTHDYPRGKPFPLVLLTVLMAALAVCWIFVAGHWLRAIGIIAGLFLLAFINGKLHEHYERIGQAVRIPRPPRTRTTVQFFHGLPRSMWATRIAFGAIVAIMLAFGFGPFADATAKAGIIACVFALISVAILNVALERIHVHEGRAREVEIKRGE